MFREINCTFIENLDTRTRIWTNNFNCKLRLNISIANIHFSNQCLKNKIAPEYSTIKMENTNKAALKIKQEEKNYSHKNKSDPYMQIWSKLNLNSETNTK